MVGFPLIYDVRWRSLEVDIRLLDFMRLSMFSGFPASLLEFRRLPTTWIVFAWTCFDVIRRVFVVVALFAFVPFLCVSGCASCFMFVCA